MLQEPGIHLHRIDLTQEGAVLETGCVYLVPLQEHLRLPAGIAARANPKSSTGRIDVFTRLITDHGVEFAMVEHGLLVKEDDDRPEDFADLFDFEEAFETDYPWGAIT